MARQQTQDKFASCRYEAAKLDSKWALEHKFNTDTRLAIFEMDNLLEPRVTVENTSRKLVPVSQIIDCGLYRFVNQLATSQRRTELA
jgi:hypothetical protein